MAYAYPILLDLSGELVVIVGGGKVAARKARSALAASAAVRVVAPAMCEDMPTEIERVLEKYAPNHVVGARLIFAATDDTRVNDAVVGDARSAGIWVSRSDSEESPEGAGNFIVPARFDKGGVIVSVSAGSAAVSVAIRDHLVAQLDPDWQRLAEVVRSLRPMVLASGLSGLGRARILRQLASPDILAMLKERNEGAVREWLLRRLAEARDE